MGWVLTEILTCICAQQQRNWQWRFEMRACSFSAMVQMHGCASKVEEVSTFHETRDTKIAILTFLSQANIHLKEQAYSFQIGEHTLTLTSSTKLVAAAMVIMRKRHMILEMLSTSIEVYIHGFCPIISLHASIVLTHTNVLRHSPYL